jgi:hypothetical protein
MENLEFFNSIDSMLNETLSKKPLKEICEAFKEDVVSNRDKYVDDSNLALEMKETGESIVRMFLENLGYVFLSKCEDISHDYKFLKGGKEFVFEIKTDVDTDNMAVEYECRGKKSGIAATKADFFITYYPQLNEIWLIKTEKLKELIRKNKDTIKKIDTADGIKLFLLKRDKYKPEFRITNVY